MTLSLLSLISDLISLYKKITNGGYSFYIHILKVPPHERGGGDTTPLLLGHSLPPYKPNQQDQYGGGGVP